MNFITEIFQGLSDTGRLFVLVFSISLIAILVSLWTGGLAATIVVSVTIGSILTITKGIWESEYDAKTKVRLASLGFVYLIAVSQPAWKSVVNPLLKSVLEVLPIPEKVLTSDTPSISALFLAVIAVYFINYFIRDATAMKEHPTPIDEEFPEKRYRQRFTSFCTFLLGDLDKIDRETNWSAEYFTPLDAEVEVQSGSKRLKKVTDLLNAIRSDRKSRVFLVIGDPGSGKSVALRKLCRELLKESEKTGKVPLYLNLREWEPENEWTEDNPPTVEELYKFVVNNLKDRGDIFVNEFIDVYFKKMFDYGRLFIVLDSFDEIPSVLDVNESSWLIDELSDVIYRFLAGANESRGILASRIFRRPTDNFAAKTTLEIRPFTESKIIETFKRSLFYDEKLIQQIFKERQEFVPVARNPFTAALISSYAQDHDNNLPQNQAELYSSYIDKRLDACQERIERRNLTKKKIIQCSIDIANTMLSTHSLGLEASIKVLKARLPQHPVEDVINILCYARLGRLGSGDQTQFSFVHRRFNEYFIVQRLIEQPQIVPQEAIPTDSRWRDALALYCEVANENEAKQIASFCWSEIEKVVQGNVDMSDPQFLRMLHCLRFLKEAFRAQLNCIEDFRADLVIFIKHTIENQKNLLLQKFAVEAVGLLKDEDIDEAVVMALNLENTWISETAIKSCRHLPKISNELKSELINYLNNLDMWTLLKKKDELLFSLNLSNGFSEITFFLKWRILDLYFCAFGTFLCFMFSPLLTVVAFVCVFLINKFYLGMSSLNRINRTSFSFLIIIIVISLFYILIFQDTEAIHKNIDITLYLFSFLNLILSELFVVKIILACLAIFLLIPSYQFFFYALPTIRRFNIKFLLLFLLTLLGISLIVLLIYLFEKLVVKTAIVNYLFLFIIFTFQILPIIFFRVSDYLKLKKITKIACLDREQITKQLKTFKTAWGRLKYVEFLQNENIKPEGNWPNGELPNFKNDAASTLLARLEEKWLGLDR